MVSVPGGLSVNARAAPPGEDLLAGSHYRVIRELGAGGMGEVLEAEHRALGHRVVAKVMREELAGRPEMFDRMRVEGQALARIRHPNLVMVTDFGQTRSGRPFVVMELLRGRSLHEELYSKAVLPVAEAAEIGRQMLLGLSAAHGAGLVHRDVKPDNVFLCESEDGRPSVKVLDFGVVKIVQAGRDPRTPEPLLVPTAENVTLGTPRYFSPEQTCGARDLDARSDLYSVGLVLYRMVVGRGPFDQYRRLPELFRAQATEVPLPPSAAAPQPIPAAFDRIVMRALAKSREDRFSDSLAFARALSRFLASLGAEGRRWLGPAGAPGGEQDTIDMEDSSAATSAAVPSVCDTDRIPEALSSAYEPTATASPVVAPARPAAGGGREGVATVREVLPSLPAKLPDGPVMIDRLVERVLGSAASPGERPSQPGQERPSQPGPVAAPDRSAKTVPLLQARMTPPAPPPSNPGRASRPSMPETVPMLDVAAYSAVPASPVVSAYPPVVHVSVAHPPAAYPPVVHVSVAHGPAAYPLVLPRAGAAWKMSLLLGVAALLVVVGGIFGYLLR